MTGMVVVGRVVVVVEGAGGGETVLDAVVVLEMVVD